MGSNSSEAEDHEQPVHTVTLSGYEISKIKVTNEQFAIFMNEKGVSTDGTCGGVLYIKMDDEYVDCCIEYSGNQFIPETGKENYPARPITWEGAKSFCEWVGGRLPTEAEWEYAARGGQQSQGYTYSGGNDIDEVAWYSSNSDGHVWPVAQKKANELGLYDMSGNEWEWCSDWYGGYASSSQTNPTGPADGTYRIIRGATWWHDVNFHRVSFRGYSVPQPEWGGYGLRPVRDP